MSSDKQVPLSAGAITVSAILFLVLLSFAFKGNVHF
jgi:hypothetical protein